MSTSLISDDLRPFVHDAVHSGRYCDEEAVVTAALRLLRELHSDQVSQQVEAALQQSLDGNVMSIADEQAHEAYFKDVRRRAVSPVTDDE